MTTTAELPGPGTPAGSFRSRLDVFYLGGGHRAGDVSWLPAERVAARLQAVQRRRAVAAAEEVELILALPGARPASYDPQPGTRGGDQ